MFEVNQRNINSKRNRSKKPHCGSLWSRLIKCHLNYFEIIPKLIFILSQVVNSSLIWCTHSGFSRIFIVLFSRCNNFTGFIRKNIMSGPTATNYQHFLMIFDRIASHRIVSRAISLLSITSLGISINYSNSLEIKIHVIKSILSDGMEWNLGHCIKQKAFEMWAKDCPGYHRRTILQIKTFFKKKNKWRRSKNCENTNLVYYLVCVHSCAWRQNFKIIINFTSTPTVGGYVQNFFNGLPCRKWTLLEIHKKTDLLILITFIIYFTPNARICKLLLSTERLSSTDLTAYLMLLNEKSWATNFRFPKTDLFQI